MKLRRFSSTEAENIKTKLLSDLRAQSVELFAARRLFDTVPVIFDTSANCTQWKLQVAEMLDVDVCSVYVIGSGCTLVSFNPHKNFRLFDDESDIDIAVISPYHFELAWRAVRHIGSGKYKLDAAGQTALQEHRNSHVFWGMFATEKILPALPFGNQWTAGALKLSGREPTLGREIKFRLYRDAYSFTGYHLAGIRRLKENVTTLP